MLASLKRQLAEGEPDHLKMRKIVLFADWHGTHASNVVVTEDLLVDCFLSHVWRDPLASKKFKDKIVKSPDS